MIKKYASADGLMSIYIDADTGMPFLDCMGYVLITQHSLSTIAHRIAKGHKGVTKGALEHYEEEIQGGYKVTYLISAAIVLGWMLEDDPVKAKLMEEVGPARYLYNLAGFTL